MKFGISHGYIVTADEAGNVTLNARVVAKAGEMADHIAPVLVKQANSYDDMLAALEQIASACTAHAMRDGDALQGCIDIARAAITKAESA